MVEEPTDFNKEKVNNIKNDLLAAKQELLNHSDTLTALYNIQRDTETDEKKKERIKDNIKEVTQTCQE